MLFKCNLGFHSWVGCTCTSCGKTRDEQHDWSIDCEKCSICGKTQVSQHDWSKDCEKCSKCDKARGGQHNWSNDCEKCSKCGKTRQNQHNWRKDCEKCSICGETRDEKHDWKRHGEKCSKCGLVKHDWNSFQCSDCGTFNYIGLLNELYRIARAGNYIFDGYFGEKKDTITLATEALSKLRTETQKQEYILKKFNYLVTVVKQHSGVGDYLPTSYLLDIQQTMKKLARKFNAQ